MKKCSACGRNLMTNYIVTYRDGVDYYYCNSYCEERVIYRDGERVIYPFYKGNDSTTTVKGAGAVHSTVTISPERNAIFEALKKMNVKQRQDSTTEQLIDVMTYANLLGCYDAADVIRNLLERKK